MTLDSRETASQGAINTSIRPVSWFRKHPVYLELRLAVSAAQLAEVRRLGEISFKDPLLVTRQGVIIDGYARKQYADSLGISTLPCVEIDAAEEEALRLILNKHRRSLGWNDYNRIRMASRLKDDFRNLARSNQRAGGRFKGSSNLTEASVRKKVAEAAGVCEGNVTKYDQLLNLDPEVLDALARGEIRIHRAWLWRRSNLQRQREELRLFRLKRGLTQPAKIRAFNHRANSVPTLSRASLSTANLRQLLEQLSAMPHDGCQSSDSIHIGVITFPGKAALLTTALYEDLLNRRRANQTCDVLFD